MLPENYKSREVAQTQQRLPEKEAVSNRQIQMMLLYKKGPQKGPEILVTVVDRGKDDTPVK